MEHVTEPSTHEHRDSSICSGCGMCCDGVLFHSVRLHPGDSPHELASLGLKLHHKKKHRFFLQPCAAFECTHCRIYEQRPSRCRDFNCRQLVLLRLGECSEETVRSRICEARHRVATINSLLAALGERHKKRHLARRVEDTCSHPLDPSTDAEAIAIRHKLLAAMKELEEFLQKHFRLASPSPD